MIFIKGDILKGNNSDRITIISAENGVYTVLKNENKEVRISQEFVETFYKLDISKLRENKTL